MGWRGATALAAVSGVAGVVVSGVMVLVLLLVDRVTLRTAGYLGSVRLGLVGAVLAAAWWVGRRALRLRSGSGPRSRPTARRRDAGAPAR